MTLSFLLYKDHNFISCLKTTGFDATPRGKLTKLSGDDLEDDFTEEPISSKKMKISDDSDEKSIEVKNSKKKQGPKIVNFVG